MSYFSFTSCFLLCFGHFTLLHSQNPGATTTFASRPGLEGASVSAIVFDLVTNAPLESYEPDQRLCPASVWKLVTTMAAMDVMGSDFRFRTTLAYSGSVVDGTLIGDLIIIGGGDPSLGSRFFSPDLKELCAEWVAAIQAAGIDSIRGQIIGNSSHFQGDGIPRTRIWEDMANYYGCGVSGLNINDNTYSVTFRTPAEANKLAEITKVTPLVPDLEISSDVTSSAIAADRAFIFGAPYETRRWVSGTLPAGKSAYDIKGSIPNPPLFAAYHLFESLQKAAIPVSEGYAAELRTIPEAATLKVISEKLSPPLEALIAHTNKVSDNLFAETFMYQLGVQNNQPTLEGGLGALATRLELMTGGSQKVFFYDGSGLSRYNAVSARQLAGILTYARRSATLQKNVLDRLPLAGREGSMRYFADSGPLSGNLRGKSGSMEKVKCYAGYFNAKTGREIGFVVLVNNFNGTPVEVRIEIERWLEAVYGTF